MIQTVFKLFILISGLIGICMTRAINNNLSNVDSCESLSEVMLVQILGPAYNSRYMSITVPDLFNNFENANGKRKVDTELSFFVSDHYSMELNEIPAWEPESLMYESNRIKRSSRRQMNEQKPSRPWECQATVKWLDLGHDYFPRFIRTIECEQHRCWYGHYTCQSRSFTVKLLRRRRGECVKSRNQQIQVTNRIGNAGLPDELRELWVWEERAINFCCDCAAPSY